MPWTERIFFCILYVCCSLSENFFLLGLLPYKNQWIDLQRKWVAWFLYAMVSCWEVLSSKLQYFCYCLFYVNKIYKADSMPDECSGRKLRLPYLWRIPLLYYALPIEHSVKIQSYYYIYKYMYICMYMYI